MSAGAICANTLDDKTEDLPLKDFLAFLEASPEKGPAICVSTDDFAKLQIALEQACRKLGKCTKAVEEEIKKVSSRVKRLSKKDG